MVNPCEANTVYKQIKYVFAGTRILLVCPFAKYTFPLLDGVFTPKLLLPARNVGQQQGALTICIENVQLWPTFKA
jgi:hypothetical protein